MPDLYDLAQMEFDEVSVVPSGDNKEAKVVLMKTDPERCEEHGHISKCPDDCPNCGPTNSKGVRGGYGKEGEQTEEERGLIRKFFDLFGVKTAADIEYIIEKSQDDGDGDGTVDDDEPSRREGTMSKDDIQELLKGLPEGDARDALEAALIEKDERIEELEEELETSEETDPDPDTDPDGDDDSDIKKVLAKADPAVREYFEKQEQRVTEAERIAKEERESRLNREMLSKAEQYGHLPGTPQERAELLKEAYAVSDEFGKKVEESMKSTNAQLAEADDKLFGTFGKSTTGDVTVSSEAEKQAEAIRKDHPDLTPEQAIRKVYEENPELWDKARAEEG